MATKVKRPVQKRATKVVEPTESFWWRFVSALPFLIVACFVAFASVAMILLLLGQLRSIFVWPLGLAAAAVAGRLVFRHADVELPGSIKERHIFGALAIGFVFLWIGFNTHYSAQDVFVFRDPGFYTVAGEWLKNHDNLVLHTPTVFGNDPAIKADTAGFEAVPTIPGRLFVQAPHLLPIMLGLAARIGGTAFMLHFNVVFGGLALLAVYGLARCFMRPRWAFMAMAVLAASLPMIYFSRDTYSEPIDMLLIMGSLSLLWLAQKKANKWLWLLAGLAGGAATMSRIDAYLVVAALLASIIVLLIVAKKEERPALAKFGIYYLVGISVTSLLGWLDVSILSTQYYKALHKQFRSEMLLVAMVIMAGIAAILVAWRSNALSWLDTKTRTWRPIIAVVVVALAAMFFASRPLWYVGHGPTNPIIFNLQQAAGQPKAHRTYAEQTVNWIAWYLGPLFTLLGAVGLGWGAYRIMQRRKYVGLVPLLVVLGITMLVYLNNPSITPYQIWAARRFLPVVFPGLCITAALALDRFSQHNILKSTTKNAVILAIVLILAPPLYISKPFLRVRIDVPELAQVNDICRALPPHAAVLVMGIDGMHLTQPISAFCGVPAMRIDVPTEPCTATTHACPTVQLPTADLASAAQAAIRKGYDPVTVVGGGDGDNFSLALTNQMKLVSSIAYDEYAMSIYSPPKVPVVYTRVILLAQLHADGSISPLQLSKYTPYR